MRGFLDGLGVPRMDPAADGRAPRGARSPSAARRGAARRGGGRSRRHHDVRRHGRLGRRVRRDARARRARRSAIARCSAPIRRSATRAIAELREKVAAMRARETRARAGRCLAARAVHRLRRALSRHGRARARARDCRSRCTSPRARWRPSSSRRARARSPTGCARAASPSRRARARRSRCSARSACSPSIRCSFTACASTTTTSARSPTIGARSRTVPPPTRGSRTASRRSPSCSRPACDVGIGTDSVASNDRMDLLDEARLALLFATARARTRRTRSPRRSARARDARRRARAAAWTRAIGSLEVGKAADLAAFPLAPLGRGPTHDPVAAAVLALAGTPASFVAVAGRPLVRDGRLLDADSSLARRVQESADRLQAWLATPDGARATSALHPTAGR